MNVKNGTSSERQNIPLMRQFSWFLAYIKYADFNMEDNVKDFDPYFTNAAVSICPRERRRNEMSFYGENLWRKLPETQ